MKWYGCSTGYWGQPICRPTERGQRWRHGLTHAHINIIKNVPTTGKPQCVPTTKTDRLKSVVRIIRNTGVSSVKMHRLLMLNRAYLPLGFKGLLWVITANFRGITEHDVYEAIRPSSLWCGLQAMQPALCDPATDSATTSTASNENKCRNIASVKCARSQNSFLL